MFALIGAMAQFERELIRERVMMGVERARRQGKRIGRRRVHTDVDTIRKLRGEGWSLRAIAKEVGVSRTTVMELLRKTKVRLEVSFSTAPGVKPDEGEGEAPAGEISSMIGCGTTPTGAIRPGNGESE
jgi:lambda repressor-like predicted transcriptional regulator